MTATEPRDLIARWRPAGLLLLAAIVALALGGAPVAHANSIIVNSKLDTADPGHCRLRDAITAANLNTVTGGCPAGSPGLDAITFDLGHACLLTQCTIVLASALPAVSQDLMINGSPYNVAISGANQYPVFDVSGSEVVTLSNLSLTNGKSPSGGGIHMNSAMLTLNNVRISGGNSDFGGAISQNHGTLYVINSTFLGNTGGRGGAIDTIGGTAVISGSTFSGNTSATSGGALAANGISNLSVTASVFVSNSADFRGGAIYLQDRTTQAAIGGSTLMHNHVLTEASDYGGGAIYDSAVLTLTNSTLAGNTSSFVGGGAYVLGGQAALTNVTLSGNTARHDGGGLFAQNLDLSTTAVVTLNNVTVTGNTADLDGDSTGDGGGIGANDGTLTILNSIIAANFDTPNNIGLGTIRPDCSGTFASPQFNLVGQGDGCTGFINGNNGNHVGASGNPLDPLLAALADNGGPTLTHALLAGSPALNAGNPATPGGGGFACAATDQRAVVRPLGPRCDMGAYEAGGLLFLPLIRR